ncbi:MAG: transcription-repair coupling factor, partial [Muribaculaceae bacterium]|nr:transcription-repair coupling factor [Muribaculaceae bacterium]
MDIREICERILTPERRKALRALPSKKGGTVASVAGSSAAVMLSGLPSKEGRPVVVIGNSLDDAGYLFFDLCRIAGEDKVAMLPSGFKRDIKYGQPDAPNQILRTETLSRLKRGQLQFLVTYPDAIAESVASAEKISSHTLHLDKRTPLD